ncbi:hypothetical protein [Pinibacter aurantiacus]|uniref:Uncharacterized protein n=1 Tax=Pinibacter aurantiacus TaxID=2851599 RepID=A0A9E2SBH9_9BACT|nr:hypothetical protein [Pinibacter aurantiacus]MBV4358109.1 hypothetical protein [Pinibacter aurantiacus]
MSTIFFTPGLPLQFPEKFILVFLWSMFAFALWAILLYMSLWFMKPRKVKSINGNQKY